jgi:hypothetical protein
VGLSLAFTIPAMSQGQLIASKEIYVDHGDYADVNNPPCKSLLENAMQIMLEGLVSGKIQVSSVDKFVGTIVELLPAVVGDSIAQTNGILGKFFKPNRYSNCGYLLFKIPPDATGLTIRVYAAGKECTQKDGPYVYCPAGWSGWGVYQDGAYVGGTFKNWSHNLARTARMEIYGSVPPPWPRTHTVVKGESLSKIAESTYGSQAWPRIYNANKAAIKDPDLIYPDQKLLLPKP